MGLIASLLLKPRGIDFALLRYLWPLVNPVQEDATPEAGIASLTLEDKPARKKREEIRLNYGRGIALWEEKIYIADSENNRLVLYDIRKRESFPSWELLRESVCGSVWGAWKQIRAGRGIFG